MRRFAGAGSLAIQRAPPRRLERPMRPNILAFAAALSTAALAAPAGASLSGFRLPGSQPTQAPPPDLQGPVAPDVPASRRTPAPTPAPTAARTGTPAAPPVEVPTDLQTRPTANPTRRATPPAPMAATPAAVETGIAATLPPLESPVVPSATAPAPVPPATVAPVAVQPEQSGWSWLWWLAALPVLLAALVLAGWVARRRIQRPFGSVAVPQIERPRVGPAPAEPPAPAMPAAPVEPLQVSLEPLRLSLTLMNATLAYRLALANRATMPLTGVTIEADMISAHASMSREEQLAGPRIGNGAAAQRIERLEPGETRVVEGEFRLPFPQIVPIRRGDAALLLPLARFRVEADGAEPFVRTFVVGQPGQGSSLQPFRLDQGPRVYPHLAQHAFA
jgi:hypothetical protein